MDWFAQTLPNIRTPEELNLILGRAKQAGRDVGRMVVERAAELHLEFDAATRGYVWLDQMKEADESGNLSDEKDAA